LREWGHRIRPHYLPKYAPEANLMELVWWRLHEMLTRNRQCQTLEQLLDNVYSWIDAQGCFYTRTLALYGIAA